MVGALRHKLRVWLGVDANEARIVVVRKQVGGTRIAFEGLRAELEDRESRLREEFSLTKEKPKPKIVAKPARAKNWRQFSEAAEKASEPEREEA